LAFRVSKSVPFFSVRPTAGQCKEFDNEVAGRGGIAFTVGSPGAAKTSALGTIERFCEEVLKPQGWDPFFIDLASTGKAAREMGLATGSSAYTVSSFTSAYAASKFDLQRANGEPLRGFFVMGAEGPESKLLKELRPKGR
jgi:Fe2+ transport system protein B